MSCNCEHIKWGTLLCALLDVKFSVASTQSWVKRVDWFFNHICSERVWSREGWAKVAQQTNVSTMLHWQLFFPFFYDWLSHNLRKQITASPRAMAYSKPPSWCLAELLNSYKWTSFFFALPLSVSCGHSHLFQPVWTSPNGPERAKLSCHSFLDETSSNIFAGGWKFPHFTQRSFCLNLTLKVMQSIEKHDDVALLLLAP